MAMMTKKLLQVLALIWVSVFCLLIVLFVAAPGNGALIKTLWVAQIALVGLWAVLYCIRGAVFVSAGVADRKKVAYQNTSRD